MRHTLLLLVAVFASCTNAQAPRAQPAPAAQVPTVRANANLVLVDVVVSREGKPVNGLPQKAFRVFEDGREQFITVFDEHAAPPGAASLSHSSSANVHTSGTPEPGAASINVILLDPLNTPADAQASAEAQLYSFLQGAQSGPLTEVFELDAGLHLLAGFSRNPADLARTLTLARSSPVASLLYDPEGEKQRAATIDSTPTAAAKRAPLVVERLRQMEALLNAEGAQDRVELTLKAFEDLSRILAVVPGRKNLIWISGSFPIAIEPDPSAKNPSSAWHSFHSEIIQTAQRLASARVAVYPIDAKGLTGLPSANAIDRYNAAGGTVDQDRVVHAAGESDDTRALGLSADQRLTMRQIADTTGGKAFVNTNAVADAIASAENDGAQYYTLGYVPAKSKLDGKFHTLKVKLNGTSYHLAYRSGYLGDTPETAAKEQGLKLPPLLASLMLGAPPATQVGLAARVIPAGGHEAQDTAPADGMQSADSPAQHQAGRRTIAQLRIDAHDVVFDVAADGSRSASVRLTLITYSSYGKPLEETDRQVNFKIGARDFARTLNDGLPVNFTLDMPAGFSFLRIAVLDPQTGRVGSVELPVAISGAG